MANDREFVDPVGPSNRLRYKWSTEDGNITDFVLQLETEVDGEYKPVVRYDTHYDRPHRDMLNPDGSVAEKQWLPEHWSRKECFDDAVADLRNNWEWYRDQFLEKHG